MVRWVCPSPLQSSLPVGRPIAAPSMAFGNGLKRAKPGSHLAIDPSGIQYTTPGEQCLKAANRTPSETPNYGILSSIQCSIIASFTLISVAIKEYMLNITGKDQR